MQLVLFKQKQFHFLEKLLKFVSMRKRSLNFQNQFLFFNSFNLAFKFRIYLLKFANVSKYAMNRSRTHGIKLFSYLILL